MTKRCAALTTIINNTINTINIVSCITIDNANVALHGESGDSYWRAA